jgi:sialate O-acetylesterase
MKFFAKSIFLVVTVALSFVNCSTAAVTLPSFFTDNMVLQQKSSVPFWGKSPAATVKVTTSWDKASYTAKVDNGNWQVNLKTPSYGGPYTITINDGTEVVLKNILIGEVWLCSGQSNMEMPLEGWGKINNFKEEIAAADYPEIRIIQAEHVDTATEQEDLKVQNGGWQVCSPATISNFSSTAYFFARKVYKEKHIPIGLIHSSWGGTIVEAWTSAGALRTTHDFDAALDAMKSEKSRDAQLAKYNTDIKVWLALLEKSDRGMKGESAVWAANDFKDASWKTMKLPGYMEFNGLPDVDGVVWFKKTFTLPENFSGKDVTLNFLADDDDKVWVNGEYIGATNGYNTPRNYTIPANKLKKGSNTITIRVYDNTGGGGIYGSASDLTLKAGDKTMPLAGEWKYAVGISSKELPAQPSYPAGNYRPSAIYNAMIHPLLKLPLAGVIWYQGESNAERAEQYQTLFPLLINDWRAKFGNKNLPFYFVQLANYKVAKIEPAESEWAELREAQMKALALPNTGMIVATDIGDAEDIHPKNKQDIGERLARIALAKQYGVAIDYSGPMYKSFAVNGGAIAVEFTFNNGLKPKSGQLKGFAIAGKDKVFYWAEAKVEGDKIIVSSAKVPNPVAVRYNWADNPDGNLTNASGLPASSFRTDAWPGITHGKK